MCDTRYWGKDFTKKFIDLYKSSPCLWKVKSNDYINKTKKNEAYDKLVQFCKQVNPDCNQELVKKKIQALRGAYRKELKKIKDAKKSGDDYEPGWWYFDQLSFIKDQDENIIEPEAETSNIKFESYVPKDETQDTNSSLEFTDIEENYEEIQPPMKRDTFETVIPKKFQFESKDVDKVFHVSEMEQIELEAVGVNVSKKLQRMDRTQAIFAESIINKVLSYGLLNKLTENSDLCEGQCKYPYSRRPSSEMSSFSEDAEIPLKKAKCLS